MDVINNKHIIKNENVPYQWVLEDRENLDCLFLQGIQNFHLFHHHQEILVILFNGKIFLMKQFTVKSYSQIFICKIEFVRLWKNRNDWCFIVLFVLNVWWKIFTLKKQYYSLLNSPGSPGLPTSPGKPVISV